MPHRTILFSLIVLLSGSPAMADTVATLLTQAHAAEAHGDTEVALRLTQSAIVADPARPASYVALGQIYAKANQPESARTYYDEALSIDPADAAALKAVATLARGKATTSGAGASAASP